MKEGQDLHPGVLGVSLKGRDLYNQPAVVAAVRVNSPAAKAGLEADDRIVEIEG